LPVPYALANVVLKAQEFNFFLFFSSQLAQHGGH
jgi:hypothetical protein